MLFRSRHMARCFTQSATGWHGKDGSERFRLQQWRPRWRIGEHRVEHGGTRQPCKRSASHRVVVLLLLVLGNEVKQTGGMRRLQDRTGIPLRDTRAWFPACWLVRRSAGGQSEHDPCRVGELRPSAISSNLARCMTSASPRMMSLTLPCDKPGCLVTQLVTQREEAMSPYRQHGP